MDSKFDIKSSTIEKGLEVAKNFVDKLVMPSIEETGLLVKDQLTMWRFKNQIKMLNKAQEYCIKHSINPKKISLKVLSPLLDYSSLEEDDEMQDKWSILLTNLIDSEQNIENHVFPYILSQLSKEEFFPLEEIYKNCIIRRESLTPELEKFKIEKNGKQEKIRENIEILNLEIKEKKSEVGNHWSNGVWELEKKVSDLEREIWSLEGEEHKIRHSIIKPEIVPEELFRDFEISNLIRLGLVKEIKEFYAESQTLEVPIDRSEEYVYSTTYANVDLDIDVNSTTEYILTELGELFFKSCKEKK